jgi:hypothetical protein
MYSQSSWGGPVDPFIDIKFFAVEASADVDPIVSLAIFEWKDQDFIGIRESPESEKVRHLALELTRCSVHATNSQYQRIEFCQEEAVKKGWCKESEIGEFLKANGSDKAGNIVYTEAIHLKDPKPKKYMIQKTGYFCILTDGFTTNEYSAVAEFRNAYGELPATQIPKLPFYGGITILYAVVAV